MISGVIEFQRYLLWEPASQTVWFFWVIRIPSSPLLASDSETKLRHHPVPMAKHWQVFY